MTQLLCLILGIIIGAAGMWAALASPVRETFGDVSWRVRLGGRLGIERRDGGAHVCQLPQPPRKVLPLRGRRR
jgi:hypothetical protein